MNEHDVTVTGPQVACSCGKSTTLTEPASAFGLAIWRVLHHQKPPDLGRKWT